MENRYVENGNRIPLKRLSKVQKEIREALAELAEYSSEIGSVFIDYNRKSCEETMMVKGLRKSDQETTNRKTHQENLAYIAVRIAKGINKKENENQNVGLSCDIIDIMARNHDIGHTFLGHSGEWWLSNIKEDYGIGYYCHNALGPRELIYTNQIYDKIIDTIKQSHPEVGDKILNRIRKNLWLIMEGINSHNGERSESEYRPNMRKTEEDFERENLYCHTKKGFDKTVTPATPEAALMRLCDKISYIPYDMVDGLREGFITGLNEEYRVVLRALGITDEEIAECEAGNYVDIPRKLQTLLINDVIKNSTGTVIKMSDETAKLMHKLRDINNRQIVNFVVLKEDNDTYPPALRKFMKEFGDLAIQEGIVEDLKQGGVSKEKMEQLLETYKGTPYEKFIRYTCRTNSEDFTYTRTIVEEATKQSIYDEQEKAREIARKKEPFGISEDFANRDNRIAKYVDYYSGRDIDQYTKEDKEQDFQRIWQNIGDEGKSSDLFMGMNERLAQELGAKYLATLNDIEFMNLLVETGTITEEQRKSLTRPYRQINLEDEVYIQANWKQIVKEQNSGVLEK